MLSKQQIADEVSKRGFTLVNSDGYKNMESMITVSCPHGHQFETNIKSVRHDSFECPLCGHDIVVNPKAVPPKKEGVKRIMGFDQATEHFGLSIYDGTTLVFYSLYTFKGTTDNRLLSIMHFIRDIVLPEWKPDFVCFEDIQKEEERGYTTLKVLGQLMGIIIVLCKDKDIPYEIVSPNVWRKFAGTAGKNRREEKILSVAKVKEMYGITVGDDVAEAILIGRYGVKMHGEGFGVRYKF